MNTDAKNVRVEINATCTVCGGILIGNINENGETFIDLDEVLDVGLPVCAGCETVYEATGNIEVLL